MWRTEVLVGEGVRAMVILDSSFLLMVAFLPAAMRLLVMAAVSMVPLRPAQ